MRWIFRALHALFLALWVGGIVFFSAATAKLFATVAAGGPGAPAREEVARILEILFPVFYAWGVALGTGVLLTIVALDCSVGARLQRALLVALMLAATIVPAATAYPRARAARLEILALGGGVVAEDDEPALAADLERAERVAALRSDFRRDHAITMACNAAVMAVGALALLLLARDLRPASPRAP